MECVTTREFDELMASKYIFTFHNRIRFDADSYSEDAHVIPETVFRWTKIPTTAKIQNFQIKEQILETEDNLVMQISDVTGKEDIFFDI